ncbi:cell wall-binding repeat-containing protein [Leifsonia sp. fls2-241-R2A-40a]|uniref:cell wall-binding repeat-containing protein n=1 Tax=Leifsonia sp. fls2-241-R2A-40a TaxID=3040290 RepID=UPI00254C20E2|nr:cell wall-binding repeat-containing protein [Leifsonia sp. fls2-241-R2A-40a]
MKRALALAATVAVSAGLLIAAPAWADAPADAPAPTPQPIAPGATVDADATPKGLPKISPRSAQAFEESARNLDPGLAAAVTRDLHIPPAQYLADAAAAQDAGALATALGAQTGAAVTPQVEGATVTVYTPDAHAAGLARAAGAEAVVGAAPKRDFGDLPLHPLADVYGGQPYFIGNGPGGSGSRCSAAFPGFALPGGAPQLLSAGHCADAPILYEINLTAPTVTGVLATLGNALGGWVPGSVQFGNDADSSLIALSAGHTPRPALLKWGGGRGAPLAGTPQAVTGVGPAVVGAPLCKSGSTTGWSCGSILATDEPVSVQGAPGTINSIIATTCSDHGDSGGAAVSGSTAVGLVSAGPDLPCTDPQYFTAFYPMASSTGGSSVTARYSSTWEPAVSVPATVTVTSLPTSAGGVISGTVAGAFPGDFIKLKLASETTVRTASIVNGTWSVSLAGAPAGATSYTVSAAWGTFSTGPAVTGDVVATQRIAGSDRFDTSVAIAKQAYPATADTVYVATGLNYPDALSAGPAAAKEKAPLLLTGPTLPESVRAEIASLHPRHIVIVGGLSAVPAAVETALAKLAPVERIAGSDRFDTSRRLASKAFGSAIPAAFVATGTNFPDALAAGAAAGAQGAPVLLVNGGWGAVDAGTAAFLTEAGTKTVKLVGGTTVVSPGVQASLGKQGISVTRLAGSDRFETAEVVGNTSFPTYTQAYVASGLGFPDALAGSALAAAKGAPLFTVNGSCVPRSVLRDLVAKNVQRAWLLGGKSVLAASIDTLRSC